MRIVLSMVTLFVVLCTGKMVMGEQLLYLAASGDKVIVAYGVEEATGKLTRRFTTELPGNPGPLAFSPDRKRIYAAMTGWNDGQAGVATLRRAADGALRLEGTAKIVSRAPYIRADRSGRYLLAAHYGAGEVTVYRIVKGVCSDTLLDQIQTERTAHCIEVDRSGRFVYVPHTAPNKVYQFQLDQATGKLKPNDPPFAEGPDRGHAYHEPRHIAFHPRLDLAYTSNENGGGISAWKVNTDDGTLELLQTLSTLPPDYEGESAAADIRLTPDARFAYVSNRDLTKRGEGQSTRDTLAGVALDEKSGRMRIIGHFPTAHFPRSFCLDLSGRYVYAAGQRSDELHAYRRNPQTGALDPIAVYKTGRVPIWVMCGAVDGS